MKKYLLLPILALILLGCGGGISSDVATNDILGDIPKLYDGYELNKERLETEQEEASSIDRKLEIEKQIKDLKSKMIVDIDAAGLSVNGKDVPFTYTKALEASSEMCYSIQSPIKIAFTPKGYFSITANAQMISKTPLKFKQIDRLNYIGYVIMVNSENKPLSVAMAYPFVSLKSGEYAAGTKLGIWDIGLQYFTDAQLWGDFAKLVFCTKDEFKSAQEEISKRFNEK